MKKIVAIILVTALIFPAFLLLKNLFSPNLPEMDLQAMEEQTVYLQPERHIYDIKADYDGKNKFEAQMNLTYVNNTGNTQKELCFHLYPNMFSSSKRVPFFKEDFYRAFPQGFSLGGIEIKQIKQDGKKTAWSMMHDDQILHVTLENPIQPEEISNIYMQFDLTVPKARFRFGYQTFGKDKITMSLGNWYPILAVYKDGQWSIDRHQAVGDCTYSDISDYTVRFTVPKDFTVAASGILENDYIENNQAVFIYSIDRIREFAATISNNYQTASEVIDGIKVTSYFHPEDKQGGFMALNVAKYALGIFNEAFGKYPYPELRIAEANYYPGGMEFPTFIMMDSGRYKNENLSNTSLERSTAHEVAHQWWYNLVGSDQINEPWLDEGITEFSTAYYFEKRYGEPGRESYFSRQVDTTIDFIKNNARHMLDPLPLFKSHSEYFAEVYVSGVLFYEELRSLIGEENLLDFFRSYLETFKYKNVNLQEFIEFLKSKNYEALDESFYNKWFNP
ncbi:MAG: M1 family metallopeptidase [Thermoanaerobacteraceae bacterium]|nr:M1 family metallopeptidase [Thermoanaerobacteraceae bacterium]